MQGAKDTFQVLVSKTIQGMQREENFADNSRRKRTESAPVILLVNQLIDEAIKMGASDIHMEPIGEVVRTRFRIDGELCEMHEPIPIAVHAFVISRIKIMSGLDITEKKVPQDGRILYSNKEEPIDIRVSTMPTIQGEKVVLRLLNAANRLLNIDELDFSEENRNTFRKICHFPYGMILNTGPVNSGKTTTLYAALNELNAVEKNIITIEDPVEYCLSGINQVQVNGKVDLTFAVGLRSILRQDPNIIMVGEIRDEETAKIAVRAALTGHLLFTTIHTSNAIGAIFRLLDMGIKPYLFSAAVRGIIAQRLVRKICPNCCESYEVERESAEASFLGTHYYEGLQLFHGKGCDKCNFTGYSGRLAIQEVLVINDEIRKSLMEGVDIVQMKILIYKFLKMVSMVQDGIEKVLRGKTTVSEILRVTDGEI
jgi:type IV pilus assembly protein PilB